MPLFFCKRPEEITKRSLFTYIHDLQLLEDKPAPVIKMYKTLNFSETGYYKWKRTRNRTKAWQRLQVNIHEIIVEHPDNDNYGIERVIIALNQRGIKNNSRSTVIRAMRKGNLLHKSKRAPNALQNQIKGQIDPKTLLKGIFSY